VSHKRLLACSELFEFSVFLYIGLVLSDLVPWQGAATGLLFYLLGATTIAIMTSSVLRRLHLYDYKVLKRGPEAAIFGFSAATLCTGPFLAALAAQCGISDSAIKTQYGLVAAGLVTIAVFRLGLAQLIEALEQAGIARSRIYIISDEASAVGSLKSTLERSPENRVVGEWTLWNHSDSPKSALAGALTFLRSHPVDFVVIKLQADRLAETVRVLRRFPCRLLLAPALPDCDDALSLPNAPVVDLWDRSGHPLLVKIADRPIDGWRWVLKDVQDRTLALLLLMFLAPLMLAIALAIRLSDPGPVLFRQKRLGYAASTFDIFKFRTMRVAPSPQGAQTLTLTTRDDPRIFALGRILRKTSLDELPQLLNVLLGDMWLIGPRPHSPLATAGGVVYGEAMQDYTARYRMKPGITGWAQVSGWRGPTDTIKQLQHRVEHDLYYIDNWSWIFDIRILFKTLFCMFPHENAF
jgi:exopolysaccharide biosynthesis polyprenyl glycosylphosphotransferase